MFKNANFLDIFSISNNLIIFPGSYFCYDTPGALADNFKDDAHLNTSQFALLYSIYSWPNVILCFIGGYLIDRYVAFDKLFTVIACMFTS